MTNAPAILRSLLVYAICIPAAIVLGYGLPSVANMPTDLSQYVPLALVLLTISFPILLNYHHAFLFLAWNAVAVVFFLPGRPSIWLLAVAISLFIALTQRMLRGRSASLHVPQLTVPLIALAGVVVITAFCTGGIGLHSLVPWLGGGVYGGRRYVILLAAVLGYFAFASQSLPREKAALYTAMFFLTGLTAMIGDFFALVKGDWRYLFLVFPPHSLNTEQIEVGTTRLSGVSTASAAVYSYLLARYGIRGIFTLMRPWRLLLFIGFSLAGFLGGYRSTIILFVLVFAFQFYFEGLHRTAMLPRLALAFVVIAVVVFPFINRMPMTFQRALAFLPVDIDPKARLDAQQSSEWRTRMWRAVLPQVPQYLLLGKGLAFSAQDYDFFTSDAMVTGLIKPISADEEGLALSGDFHNGPLTVVIPFGLWGVGVALWFFWAGVRCLYRNYRYGDAALKNINTFILAAFVAHIVLFCIVFGSFQNDLWFFTGLLGLSVSLNGGMAQPAPVAPPAVEQAPRSFAAVFPRPRHALGR